MKQVQRHQQRGKFAAYNRQSFGKINIYSNMSTKNCQTTQKGEIHKNKKNTDIQISR